MTEPNIWWKTVGPDTIRVAIYVDNLLVAWPKTKGGRALGAAYKKDLAARFKVDLRGKPSKFLGAEIAQTGTTITLTQTEYIAAVGAKFLSGPNTHTFPTPLPKSKMDDWNKLSVASSDVERAEMRSKPYLALVGSLLWATLTHPECTYYVAFLCQFMHDPSPDAYEAALGILAYLVGVKDMGITYDRSDDPTPTVYSDSSWGQVPKPFGGWVVMAYNGAVSFAARKLKIVPISTAEAETAVYSAACRDLQYISSIMGEDGFQLQKKMKMPATVYCDNDSAVSTVKNLGSTARTRHFERWTLYGREQFIKLLSVPRWISTFHQVGDIFTKPLPQDSFSRFRSVLLNLPQRGRHAPGRRGAANAFGLFFNVHDPEPHSWDVARAGPGPGGDKNLGLATEL